MNKRSQESPAAFPRLMDIKMLQAYLSLGARSADQLARDAGARKRFGKRVLYDRELIDSHISVMM